MILTDELCDRLCAAAVEGAPLMAIQANDPRI